MGSWPTQDEIVRKAVRNPLRTKQSMVQRELPLLRVGGVTHGHPTKIAEPGVSKYEIKDERRAERQKERREITYRLPVE